MLVHRGDELVTTYHARPLPGGRPLDVRDREAVQRCVAEARPNAVFLAVITHGGVDHDEAHPDEARAVQVEGSENVARAAGQWGARVVFYSTDYLFDGTAGPFAEDDPPRPINVYGRVKWEAEQVIQSVAADALILRTTVVFGWDSQSKNFAMQVWERLRSGTPMRVPDDQWGNPTLAQDLAEVSVRLLETGASGVFNVVGHDWLVRSDFGKAVAASLELDPGLICPVATVTLGQRAQRPLRGGLTTSKLERWLGSPRPGLEESLRRFRAQRLAASGAEVRSPDACRTLRGSRS